MINGICIEHFLQIYRFILSSTKSFIKYELSLCKLSHIVYSDLWKFISRYVSIRAMYDAGVLVLLDLEILFEDNFNNINFVENEEGEFNIYIWEYQRDKL